MDARQPAILFFDGVCTLCNATVDRLMRWDRQGVLRFASLQGPTAQARLAPALREGLRSLVLLDEDGAHQRSEAVLRVLARLGGGWRVLAVALRIVPRVLRDGVYDGVAASRYRVFGKRETCRVPTPEERNRLLD